MIMRKIGICLITALLLSPLSIIAGQYVTIEGIDLSTSYPTGRIFLTVKGIPGSRVTNPEKNIISIVEDGVPIDPGIQVVKQKDAHNYLYMVFSIDSSKSISKKLMSGIKTAAREIAANIGPNDAIAVYHFDDSVTKLNDFTRNTDLIIKSINSIERHGKKTLLYNALYDSIELLKKVDQDNKKIIVFTDGKDEGSSVRDDDIIQMARDSGIPIYFICCKKSSRLSVMARISKMSGGKVVCSNRHDDIAGMYRTVLSIIKNTYVVEYPSRIRRDGKNHEIEVRVRHGDIIDRDSLIVPAPGFAVWGDVSLWCVVLCGIGMVFLLLLLVIIIYFMNREKNILRKSFENQKKLLMESMLRAGSPQAEPNQGGSTARFPNDPETQYDRAWVYEKKAPGIGNKHVLIIPEMVIGSDHQCDLVLQDDSVSPRHAKIKYINGSYYLFDLISDEGIFLNGKKLLRPKALYDWDEITMGNTLLIFRGAVQSID